MITCHACGAVMDPDNMAGWKWVWNRKRPWERVKFSCGNHGQLRLFD